VQAIRWHGRGDVRLEDVPEPDAPGPGRAVVEVAYCGICGSDLAEYRDGPKLIRPTPHPLTGQAPPITLGHELSGRVVAADDQLAWPAGTRVTVDACWRCGTCDACRSGAYQRCPDGGSIGLHSDGGLARFVVVPEYCLVAVPDGVPDRHAALSEPFAVALHALDRGAAQAGDEVLVLGFGAIGAASALAARALGARAPVVELEPARQTRAEELGFATLDPGNGLARRVRRLLGGGADVVVESTGAPALLPVAVECARRGGRVSLVGLGAATATLDPARLVLFERSLIGSLGYQHDIPRALAMMDAGLIDPDAMIAGVVPLGAAVDTIAELAARPDGRIKVLVEPALGGGT
jgi:(R,R)-butanediol dehydrogenase / meso-butanediol dehydrogenase / diacetyl reductase